MPPHAIPTWADDDNLYLLIDDTIVTFPLTSMSKAIPLLRKEPPARKTYVQTRRADPIADRVSTILQSMGVR